MFKVVMTNDWGDIEEENSYNTIEAALEEVKNRIITDRVSSNCIKLYQEVPLDIIVLVQQSIVTGKQIGRAHV